MSDPFRLVVLKKLSAVLGEIVYEDTPMVDRVFRGRTIFGADYPLPMLSILEPPIPIEVMMRANDNLTSMGKWELLVQGFVPDDHENPTDPAHRLMAVVKARLVQERKRENGRNILGMNGRVTNLSIGQGSVRPPDDVSDKAYFWLVLTLQLVEHLERPYD